MVQLTTPSACCLTTRTAGVARRIENGMLNDQLACLCVEKRMSAAVGNLTTRRPRVLVKVDDEENRPFFTRGQGAWRIILEDDFADLTIAFGF